MVAECTAIIAIILLIFAICVRKGKLGTGLAILPLGIVPLFYLVSGHIATFINIWQTPDVYLHMRIGVITVGALLAGMLMGFIAGRITHKANRRAYLVLCGGFTVVLFIIMIVRVIGPVSTLL